MKIGSLVRFTERATDKDFYTWRKTYFGIVTWFEKTHPMVEVYWVKDKYRCMQNVDWLEVLCE